MAPPGVAVGTPQEEREDFIAANKLEWPQVVDEYGKASDLFGVRGHPTHLLIDAEGRIVYRRDG